MSAPEAAAPVVDSKPNDTPVAAQEVAVAVEETPKVEEAPAPVPVAEEPASAEPAAAETTAEVAQEVAPEESKPAADAEGAKPKSPGLLAKLLAPFKGDKKPKSPKKEKKKEEVEAAAVTEEAPKEEAAAENVEAVVETSEEPAKEETAKETETPEAVPGAAPVAEAVAALNEVKEEKEEILKEKVSKTAKVGRRLSARVGDFFKPKPKTEVTTPAKVDEHPPKIDEPSPVAPLENPASESAAPVPATSEEPAKLVEVPVAA